MAEADDTGYSLCKRCPGAVPHTDTQRSTGSPSPLPSPLSPLPSTAPPYPAAMVPFGASLPGGGMHTHSSARP